MEEFTLFVNGKDVDTGKYEYFPYADQAILDFKKTYQTITKLKRGEIPEDVDKYIYAKYCVGDNELNKQAIESAYRASKIMKNMPISKRKKIVLDILKNLERNEEKFINILVIEGHPYNLAKWEFHSMLKGLSETSNNLCKNDLFRELGSEGNERTYSVRKPDGVIVVSPPKNASASNSLAAVYAFLSGNAVIVKAPLKAPIATIFAWKNIVVKVLKENNAPDGVLNIINGNAKNIMDEWISNSKVNDIFFFGESEHGLELAKRGYNNGKKMILELSGNDNLYVWHDCNFDDAVKASLDAFLGSTQICMVPKNIIVHEDIYDLFIEKFICEVKKTKIALPSNSETVLTPVIKMKECQEFLEEALNKKGELLCGGKRVDHNGIENERGVYFQPTLVEFDTENLDLYNIRLIKEENFFPVIPVIKVKSIKNNKIDRDKDIFNKMLEIAENNEYGLRASVWVKSPHYTRQFMKYIDNSGLLRINSRHVDVSPYNAVHGGVGKTGGPSGEMNYIWQKTSHLQGISLTRK
ncbi:MAG: aldehyde dehydrogenase family protein [Endomicrobiaceae bacterium]|nr:aldehyde dehydrogenase family protein [Endomicrobiaceae bacterium]